MMKKIYDLIVIDSGTDVRHDYFRKLGYEIDVLSFEVNGDGTVNIENIASDEIGHGTAVCSIICRKDMPLKVLSINVFKNESIDETVLLSVLKFIDKFYSVKVLHLSIGVVAVNDKEMLHNSCKNLITNGTIIVAAFSNDGALTYPAAFPEVIGIDASFKCSKKTDMIYVENSPINIRAMGISQRLPWINNGYKMLMGASFAAPHITYRILCYLKRGVLKDEILKTLASEANSIIKSDENILGKPKKIFPINKAIVLPFNKEVHSLLKYVDQLTFQVIGYYDHPGLIRREKKYFEEISIGGYQLKGWDSINWDEDFDTVILGHMIQLSETLQHDYLRHFLEKCYNNHKNVVSFDPLSNYSSLVSLMEEEGILVYYPAIERSFTNKNWLGKMSEVSIPVVMVVGTSKRQGKFSLQLSLRKYFQKRGYFAGQLSTEPSGELFGCDFVYPMGFNACIKTSGLDSISNVRFLLEKMSDNKYDVIISGTQSQTIPTTLNNTAAIPLMNYEFIVGADPEVFVLVINVEDGLEYINKTINFCESICFGKVIAIYISPIKQSDHWAMLGNDIVLHDHETLLRKRKEMEVLKIPVFIPNEEMKITDCIITYLEE